MFCLFNTLVPPTFSSSMSSFWPLTDHKNYNSTCITLSNEDQCVVSVLDSPKFSVFKFKVIFNCSNIYKLIVSLCYIIIWKDVKASLKTETSL